ncbi:hypothetical protein BDV98DRAFT_607412 [Pterulicium gracile]|uniref:Uncharacterized protein n=1 Tax=Pterulicium gracile TaxID=1884261 RepID=A0A5C3Q6U9_9AGAR|nr:hypothetical protein BDV98DRAFT_607412 [Pterula gracilis]
MTESIPLIGHIKGLVHLVRGEKDKFWESKEQATRTLVVLGAGALGVSTGGTAAPILAGVVAGLAYDGVITGVESARYGSFQPQGYVATGSDLAGDWRGGIFDTIALGVGDGWVGSEGGSARTTKVYRVEGESYIIARDGQVVWDSNRRLFPGGDGVGVDQDHLPTVTYSPARPEQMAVNLGLSGPGRPKGNMLFLNYGECVRADTFFAQRVLQYHEAVDLMKARGMEVLHDHHNMKIRSFTYGCIRVVFVDLPGHVLHALLHFGLASDLANRLASGSQNQPAKLTSMPLPLSQFNETAIESVHAGEAKCGRRLQTDVDHGRHFEYLAEFPDGSTHWYPSVLVAKDLINEFESISTAIISRGAGLARGAILAMYYHEGEKEFMRWKNLRDYTVRSAAGTVFRVAFNIAQGNQLAAQLFID